MKNANPANVINMSLGDLDPPECKITPAEDLPACLQQAVDKAEEMNVVVVVSAGNERMRCNALPEQVSSPARLTNVISVPAIGPDGGSAPYSNLASYNFIAAPGGDGTFPEGGVLSTVPGSKFEQKDWEGTSMAAPHVAGVVALMFSAAKDAGRTLTAANARGILAETALDAGVPGRDSEFGHGIIQAHRAVRRAAGIADPTTPILTVTPDPLNFGAGLSTRKLTIHNRGGGSFQVTSANFTPDKATDGNWATVSPTAGAAILTVTANRGALGEGLYKGRITLETRAGNDEETVEVPVTMTVGGAVDIGPVMVMLVDEDGNQVMDGNNPVQAMTDASRGYEFSLDDFPVAADAESEGYRIEIEGDGEGKAQFTGRFPLPGERDPIAIGRPAEGSDPIEDIAQLIPVSREGAKEELSGASGDALAAGNDSLYVAVVYKGTNETIPGARVFVDKGANRVGDQTTDSFGEAVFDGLTGPVTVTATAPGFNVVTFLDINSDYLAVELEELSLDFNEVDMGLLLDQRVGADEQAFASAIIDGQLAGSLSEVNSDTSQKFQVRGGEQFLISLIVTEEETNTIKNFEVFEVEELFEDAEFRLPVDNINTVTDRVDYTGTFPTLPAGTAEVAAGIFAFDDDDSEVILAFDAENQAGDSIRLSRERFDEEDEKGVQAQLVLYATAFDPCDDCPPGVFTDGPFDQNGSDDCASATEIVGVGEFTFDNTNATKEDGIGQSTPDCDAFGGVGVDKDVWYTWTASATGTATISTEGLTGVDTKIAAYSGTDCPNGTQPIECNEDSVDLQSKISFPIEQGAKVKLQIGTFPGGGGSDPAPGGTGQFKISIDPAPGTGSSESDPDDQDDDLYSAAFQYGTLEELSASTQFPNLTLRSVPTLTSPSNDAEGLSLTPQFTFDTAPDADLVLLAIEGSFVVPNSNPPEFESFCWYVFADGDTESITLPALGNFGLKRNSVYEWYVSDYELDESVDFEFNGFLTEFSDFVTKETESALRSFSTVK